MSWVSKLPVSLLPPALDNILIGQLAGILLAVSFFFFKKRKGNFKRIIYLRIFQPSSVVLACPVQFCP